MAAPPQITAHGQNPGAIIPITFTDAQGSRLVTFSESNAPAPTGIFSDTDAPTAVATTTSTLQATSFSSSTSRMSSSATSSSSAVPAASSGGLDPTLKLVAILIPIVVVLALIPLAYLFYIHQRSKHENAALRQSSPESQRAPAETKLLAHKTSRSDHSISVIPSSFSDSNRLRTGSFDIFNPPMSTSASPLGPHNYSNSYSNSKSTASYTPLAPINLTTISPPTAAASSQRSRLDTKPPPTYSDSTSRPSQSQSHLSTNTTPPHHSQRSQYSPANTHNRHDSTTRHSGRPSSELERAPSPTLPSPSLPTFRAQEAWPLPATTASSGIASLHPGNLRPPSSVYATSTRSPQRAVFGSGIGEARTTTPMDDPPIGFAFSSGRGDGAGPRMSDAVSELSFSTSAERGRDIDEMSIVSAMGGEDDHRARAR